MGSLVILVGLGIFFISNNKSKDSSYVKNTPVVENPSIISPPIGVPRSYSLLEVTAHNTKSSCWTAINGEVYDVTSWIVKHPGGSSAIISLCGIDGSSAFDGQHGGQRRQASELANFKIGSLK